MNNSEKQKIRKLQRRALRLCDEFAQFTDQCAFLCDSFAAIPAQHESVEPETIEGANNYSYWLKTRVVELKGELHKLHEQLRTLK